MDKVYTSAQIADMIEANKKTIERKIREGELKGYKPLGKWIVFHSDLVAWIKGK